MNYYLGILAGRSDKWMPISRERYSEIGDHKSNLIHSLEIEEKFDILLGNYREFEEDILKMALHHAIISSYHLQNMNTQRRELNRRIANLLSSARVYLDHLDRHLKMIFGERSK